MRFGLFHYTPRNLALGLFLALFSIVFITPPAHASMTLANKMNFQGRLTDTSGNPLNVTVDMQFKLYDAPTSGTLMWAETRTAANSNSVTVTNGLFSIKLGEGTLAAPSTQLNAIIAANPTLYFEVTVGADTAMTPRTQLATSAYAFSSDTLDGLDSTAFGQLGTSNLWTGANTINAANASAFTVVNGATSLLKVDTTNSIITLGTSDTVGAVLVLDVKTNAGDPTGSSAVIGAMYYNSSLNKFRCYQNTGWTDCIGTGTGASLSANNTFTGTNLFKPSTDSPTALQIQNSTATATLFTADTTSNKITLGSGTSLRLTGGAFATRPASPTAGMLYYDSDSKQLLTYANSKWQADRSAVTKIVAASDSSQALKDSADYVVTGMADDEVQAALTAAAGGRVYLAEGTYDINSNLTMPSNTTLAGAGRGTLLRLPAHPSATGYDAIISQNTGDTGLVIQDIRFDGQKAIQTCAGGCSQTAFYSWEVGYGSGAAAVQGVRFQHVWIENFKDNGILFNSSSNDMVTDSYFKGNDVSGIYSGNNSTYTGNFFQGNAKGLWLRGSGNTVTGNTFEGNTQGLMGTGATDNAITGNTFATNSTAIYFEAASNKNTISGNSISDSGGATTNEAIILDSSDNNSITGNVITDTSCTTSCDAISFIFGSANNYLADNTLSGDGTNLATIYDVAGGAIYAGQSTANGGLDMLFRQTNSASAFEVQRADNTPLFTVDTTNNRVQIGSSTADATALVFVVDSYNQATDPTGVAGGMYYNTLAAKFRCYEGGAWINCTGPKYATAAPAQAFTAGTAAYITGSVVTIPSTGLRVGATITWRVIMSKTAAGTTAGTIAIYSGTSGTVPASDTSRQSFTTGTPTAIADTAVYTVTAYVSTGGATTVLWSNLTMTHNTANTGFANASGVAVYGTSASFNSTTNTKIGLVMNTGTASVVTVQQVQVQTSNL